MREAPLPDTQERPQGREPAGRRQRPRLPVRRLLAFDLGHGQQHGSPQDGWAIMDSAAKLQCEMLLLILQQLYEIRGQMEDVMSEQSQIDADVTALTTVVGDIGTQAAAIGTAITAIQQELQNPEPDLSALNALVGQAQAAQSGLDTQVSALGTLAAPPASSGGGTSSATGTPET